MAPSSSNATLESSCWAAIWQELSVITERIQLIHKRKSWDEYFLDLALTAAGMSTCPRASVGAVVAKDNETISTGFNGAPRGEPHCLDVGCLMKNGHCIQAIHAEAIAIIFSGIQRTRDSVLYVTHAPCWFCAGLIINAQIARIVYAQEYRDLAGPRRLRDAGIISSVSNS